MEEEEKQGVYVPRTNSIQFEPVQLTGMSSVFALHVFICSNFGSVLLVSL